MQLCITVVAGERHRKADAVNTEMMLQRVASWDDLVVVSTFSPPLIDPPVFLMRRYVIGRGVANHVALASQNGEILQLVKM